MREGLSLPIVRETDLRMPPIDLTPLLPAERLDIAFIESSMARFGRRRVLASKLHSAWNHVEYALNLHSGISDEMRAIYLEYAQGLIGEIVQNHTIEQQLHLDALTLSSYIPVFQKRSRSEPVANTDCKAVYESLGNVISYLRPPSESPQAGPRMEELMVLAISARISRPQFLLFPASPREESSSSPPWNHDSYFYVAAEKRPLQQKRVATEKQYDEQITRLILQPIIEKAIKRKGEVAVDTIEAQIEYILSLIVAESHQDELDLSEKRLLDHLCQAIAAHQVVHEAAA